MKKILEKNIQKKIISWLQSKGIYCIKIIVANSSGRPDIVCCIKGYFLALEVKQPGGTQTPLQVYNEYRINDSGGVYYLIESFEEAKEVVTNFIHKTDGSSTKQYK